MRLTAIRLAGFKSFVDPVTIPFSGNMTAVVGPNGCGKSNIIDAVRWVMGESSAKTLRGESMADVIFNGSNARKPVSQASIELHFDNREGSLGGVYTQYAEIAVKRQVTRDGQSVYYFNGQKCRRRDIADLFMGTGLGPRSYAIIGQGMISRLIESRPDDLRATLEEAAGISRYKDRRRDTENRMRRTQENMDRLDDIREELSRQLDKLARQAEAAKRYQDLQQQEHQLKGELALLRKHAFDCLEANHTHQVNALELAVEKSLFELREGETRIEHHRERQVTLGERLEQRQQAFHATTTQIARLEQDQSHRQARQSQLAADLERVRRELESLRENDQADQQRLHEITARLGDLAIELEALSAHKQRLEEQHQSAKGGLDEADAATAEADDAWRLASRDAERRKDQATACEEQYKRSRDERQRRFQQQQALEDSATLIHQQAQARESLETLDEQLQALHAETAGDHQALNEGRQRRQEVQQERDQVRSELSRLQGEQASLQALLAAALAEQDPAINDALELRGLADAPCLGDVLEVEAPWESTVSWLLAPWLAARLVSPDQLLPWDRTLSTDAGLIADLPLSSTPSSGCLAARVRRAGCLAGWLETIRCAGSASEARSLVAELPEGHSVITPDGLWLSSGWVRQQGHPDGMDALLVTRKRLEECQAQLDQHEQRLSRLEAELSGLSAQVEALEGRRESARADERDLTARRHQHAMAEQRLAEKVAYQAQRAEEMDQELARLDEENAELELVIEAQRSHWNHAMEVLEAATLKRESVQQQQLEHREYLERLTQELAPLQAKEPALVLERERLSTEQAGLDTQKNRLVETEQRLTDRIEALDAEREALIEPAMMDEERLETLLDQRDQQEQALSQVRDDVNDVNEQIRQDELERQSIEHQLDQDRTALQQHRMDAQALAMKAAAQQEQLDELGHDTEALKAGLEGLLDSRSQQAAPEQANAEQERQQALERISERIKKLGAINLAAIEEYQQQAERRDYIEGQHQELGEALETLERAIKRIDNETRTRFKATFDQVNEGLQALFPRIFGGGTAWLTLTGDDLLETGVAIMARPPGKKNSTIHLLSGGEKALTALALVFAIFQLNPAPFCMLDEVDAPLDDANVGRYAKLVKEMSSNVQFIFITHNKIAMEAAERLMGVTMQEPGVSRLVSVGLDQAAALVDQA